MDPGGMGELGIVEAELGDDGVLIIRLFKRKYLLNDEGEIVKMKGEQIDVRLNMPATSLFNQRLISPAAED